MKKLFLRVFPALFFLSAASLCFLAGAGASYFGWGFASPLFDAFDKANLMYGQYKQAKLLEQTPLVTDQKIGESAAHPKKRLTWNAQKAYNGYTLVSQSFSTTVYLLDMEGKIAHRWQMPFNKAWPQRGQKKIDFLSTSVPYIETAYLFPNGDLVAQYATFGTTPYGYGVAKMDKNSNLLWTYDANTHHDMYVDDKTGDIYVIDQKLEKKPHPAFADFRYPVYVDYVVKLSSDGKEISRLSLFDAFAGTSFAPLLYSSGDRKKWDAFHTNTIALIGPEMAGAFPSFNAGDILVNLRNIRLIAVIDAHSKKVKWVWRGFWRFAHAVTPLNNGHLMYFDNQGHLTKDGYFSRVVEFDPKTTQIAWYYAGSKAEPLSSNSHDRLQRLPNGNTLIGAGSSRHIVEVTPQNEVVWDFYYRDFGTPVGMAWTSTVRRYTAEQVPFLQAR